MNRKSFCLLFGVVICLTAGNLRAADAWKTASVLPKDPNALTLRGNSTRPGNEYAGNAFQIAWPARVEKSVGQWILIGDKGGYSVPPVKGWVRKEEMLCILDDDTKSAGDNPVQYLAEKALETSDPATLTALLWLRGIYWESQQEPQIAMRDYAATVRSAFGLKVDPSLPSDSAVDLFRPDQGTDAARDAFARFPGLADTYLRLARLSTKGGSSVTSSAAGQPGSTAPWKTYFACADYLFRLRSSAGDAMSRVPALDTEWADALAAEYERLLTARRAAPPAKTSKTSSQSADSTTAAAATIQPANETDATAARADSLYQSAIAVNPAWLNAFMGRGKLLLGQANALRGAKGTKPSQQSQDLYNQAIQQFTVAIQFDPKSREAFRNRAQAYQLLAGHPQLKTRYQDRVRYLSQAAQSADTASQIGRDRDPACLELLAAVVENYGDIYTELNAPKSAANYFKQASYYLQEAAACPNVDRTQIQDSVTRCRQKAGQQQMLVANSRAGEDEVRPEPKLPFYMPGSNLFGDQNKE